MPVICTGGFQTASVIRKAITDGDCDAVSMARPLVANNDLVKQFAAGTRPRGAGRAPTATSASCTSSSIRSAATRRAGSRSTEAMLHGGHVGLSAAAVSVIATACATLVRGCLVVVAGSWRRRGRRLGARRRSAPIGPSTYDGHPGAFQVRVDRQRAGRLAAGAGRRRAAAVLGVQGAAVDLQRQAAGRLRVGSASIIEPGQRPADRRLAAPAARHRSGRAQLRGLPHRHGPRHAGRGAAGRARHAGAPARSAGVRAVRARLHARQPADRRRGSRPPAEDAAGRRCSSGCCCGPAWSIA